MPKHHLSDELLMDYAAGACSEPVSLLVATHLALCPDCRARASGFEAVGGALLDDLPETAVAAGSLDALMARLDEPEAPIQAKVPAPTGDPARMLPQPLRDYVGGDLSTLNWRRATRGVERADIAIPGDDGYAAQVLRIRPGCAVPQHSHRGDEYVMVLTGGYTDESGDFERGDVQIADPDVEHKPVAMEGEDCICLAVMDAPVRLTGPIGRLFNPFVR